MPTQAFIALGSNLGDRAARLQFAARAIDALSGVSFAQGSHVYETDPVGPGEQGAYLNAVIEVSTTRTAQDLLAALLAIELTAGRRREQEAERWGPRVLDLDLVLFGDERIDEPGLCVPHPRLHERAFVLEPLSELAGQRVHPVRGGEIAALAAEVRDSKAVRRQQGGPLRCR